MARLAKQCTSSLGRGQRGAKDGELNGQALFLRWLCRLFSSVHLLRSRAAEDSELISTTLLFSSRDLQERGLWLSLRVLLRCIRTEGSTVHVPVIQAP